MQRPSPPPRLARPITRALAALALFAACSSAPRLSLDDRRAIFAEAWQMIGEKHFDEAMGGIDWQEVRRRYAPRVDAARNEGELLAVLNAMTAELQHSHVAVLPPERAAAAPKAEPQAARAGGTAADAAGGEPAAPAEPATGDDSGTIGLRAAWIEDGIVVTHVAAGSGAAAAGVQPGDEILAIDGSSTAPAVARARARGGKHWTGFVPYFVAGMLSGPIDSAVAIEVRTAGATARTVTAARHAPEMPPMELGNLGTMAAEFESRRLDDGVLYVRFTPCFTPLQLRLEQALEGAPDATGVILDLRGNPGGLGALAMGVARHFLQDERELGAMRMRGSKEPLRFKVNPAEQPFRGPVTLIVDAATGSTAEILAAGLQKIGRARVVGETSMGAALPSVIETIACGWRVQAVVADFTLPDGTSVEGTGVVPDVPVAATRADFAAGRDPFLDAALRELGNAPRLAEAAAASPAAAAAPAAARPPCEMDAATAEFFARLLADPGTRRLAAAKTLRTTSRLEVMGMGGPSVTTIQAPDKVHSASSMAGIGDTLQVFDGKQGWSRTPFEGLRELTGEELHVLARTARLDAAAWREQFAKLEIVERKREGERDLVVLRQTPHAGEGTPIVMTMDADSLQMVRLTMTVKSRMGSLPVSTEVVDYATFDGVTLPQKTIAKVGGASLVTVLEKLELDVPVDASLFVKPAKAQPAGARK